MLEHNPHIDVEYWYKPLPGLIDPDTEKLAKPS
jgi:hypothetical protein